MKASLFGRWIVSFTGISFEASSDEPLYRQLFDQIVARIRSGTFPAGYRLPPTRSFATELSTHRNTIVHAYEELEAAGFVRSTVGRGTFVVAPPAPAPTVEGQDAHGRAGLPWASLVSNALNTERLDRSERMARTANPLGAINLNRMQPPSDLLPTELFRRCIDHVLRSVGSRALEYTPREGLPRLRGLIADSPGGIARPSRRV